MRYGIFHFFVCLSVFLVACAGDGNSTSSTNNDEQQNRLAQFKSPPHGKKFRLGETVEVEIELLAENANAKVFVNKQMMQSGSGKSVKGVIPEELKILGRNNIEYEVTANGKTEKRYVSFINLPNKPAKWNYKVVNTFKHDKAAYTQGLLWHNGVLYESTGQYGESTIRKVDLETGEVLAKKDLERKYFGEGLTLFNDKLYQITWTSNQGFIYNKNTLELEKEFTYNTDGWGLEHNDSQLILTDGSHKIYFLNPNNFQIEKTLEVYDNNGLVEKLNELEMINGQLWANIYTTRRVVVINPKTGVVEAEIDFSDIVKGVEHAQMDYFNGIAYNQADNEIYVTGKNWMKLYKVKIIARIR